MARKKRKPSLKLNSAENIQKKLSARQQKQIKQMFVDLAKKAEKEAEKLKGKDNISSVLRRKYLQDIAKELEKQVDLDFTRIHRMIKENMEESSESVIECIREFEEKIGFPAKYAWMNIPTDAVVAVTSGKLYRGNWSLSNSIWGLDNKIKKDIQKVVAQGIAMNMSAYDIAKDLEKYVNPSAKKSWEWSKVYPGTNKKVDYSAQRLARTMVHHAFQYTFVEGTKHNPFITKYKWISSKKDKRLCKICEERDGKLYDKDKLPLDHPNGRCTFVAVFDKSMTEIGDDLAAWVKGKEGDYPEIDNYINKMFSSSSKNFDDKEKIFKKKR